MAYNPLTKILHVDDDPVMRLMTKKALDRSGHSYTVLSCASGQDFLKEIGTFAPDLLLVDMVMPIMDGETLIEKLRSMDVSGCKAPVIYITGRPDVTFRNRTVLEPIIGIIQKPFTAGTIGQDILNLWNHTQV
jgi:CheY-like chemotaxis protein